MSDLLETIHGVFGGVLYVALLFLVLAPIGYLGIALAWIGKQMELQSNRAADALERLLI
jgi:hypothetical protein